MSFAGSLDTNAILRLILDDIPAQRDLVVKLLNSTTKQFMVADIALIELVFVLERYYKYSRAAVAETVRNFMTASQINCNRVMFDAALEVYADNSQLSFEDCALAAYAELNNAAPLYTFDKKLAKTVDHVELIV